jgi:hypothetical protein
MTRPLAWLAAAALLGSAGCAAVRAEQARKKYLSAELDRVRYAQPLDEIWSAVRRLLADGRFPMTGDDAKATGQKEEFLALLSPSRETRETRDGGRWLETSWGPGNVRYRVEAIPEGDRWRVATTAIQRDPSMSYSEERRRGLELELALAHRLDPEAAARIEAGLAGGPAAAAPAVAAMAAAPPDTGVDRMRPTVLGIEPMRSPFSSVAPLLGDAPQARDRLGGESTPFVLCYHPRGRESGPFLLVESGAAGGYGRGPVTGFRLLREPPKTLRAVRETPAGTPAGPGEEGSRLCRPAAGPDVPWRFSNGLELGMSRRRIRELLGAPSVEFESRLVYERGDRNGPGAEGGPAPGDYARIDVELVGDSAQAIHVVRSDMD